MDLIFWRHAEAEVESPSGDDLSRALTAKGERDAARMGQWLDQHLPESARILSSPARRCEQTAQGLGRKFKLRPELAPGLGHEALLSAAQWPDAKALTVVVGHQPTIGQAIGSLLKIPGGDLTVRKGGIWWLRARERNGDRQIVVVAVLPPELA